MRMYFGFRSVHELGEKGFRSGGGSAGGGAAFGRGALPLRPVSLPLKGTLYCAVGARGGLFLLSTGGC